MKPDLGRQAAEENRAEIGEFVKDADLVFITAGFGGGTGTGATPIIAEAAKQAGALTIAIVAKPFAFEGGQRDRIATEGLLRLKDKVDALIVVPNDRIFHVISKDTPIIPCCSIPAMSVHRISSSRRCMTGCRMVMISPRRWATCASGGRSPATTATRLQAVPQTRGPVSIHVDRDRVGLPYFAEQVSLEKIELVGLDLSMGMLRRCRARIRPYEATSLLVQANAERLPLADHSFDVVLHLGGINFFDQPAVAVKEMVRVAKAGAFILIADETKIVVKKNYQRSPLTRSYFKDAPLDFSPRDWSPPGVSDPIYEEVWDRKGYMLSFRAPVP